MSIKKLFESDKVVQEYVTNATAKNIYEGSAESSRNISAILEDQKRYVPQVDFSQPNNFAKFGSARLYYKSAIKRIVDFYPYDGSDAEINEFLNGCLDIERYVLDNQYPQSTGYIELGYGGYSVSSITGGYGLPTATEAIDFVGGPGLGAASSANMKDLLPNPKDSKHNYSNIYDENIYQTAGLPDDYGKGTRTSNLKSNFDDGVTLEFWLKTGSLNPSSITSKQVIFDLTNNRAADKTDYSRLTIELTSSHAASGDPQRPFMITVQSGAHASRDYLSLGASSLHNSMGDWNHYAIRIFNTGSMLKTELYVNGQRSDIATRMPYDISLNNLGYLSSVYGATEDSQQRSWPHAIEADYSSSADLQGWWRLNNSSSATARVDDMSGRGRNGTFNALNDFPVISASVPSNYIQQATSSLSFDGSNDRIDIGTATTWDRIIGNDTANGSTQKMSFSTWIKPKSDGNNNFGRILDFGDQDVAIFVGGESSGQVYLYYSAKFSTTEGIWRTTSRAINLHKWTHVAVTFDADSNSNNPKIYINGTEVAITETQAPAGNYDGITSQNCYIGSNASDNRHFDGELADVAVWNSILGANEIRAIYSAAKINSTTHTVGELGPKNLKGRIGALQFSPAGFSGIGPGYSHGAGRLSGSLDEFRFWKTKRSSRFIGENWFKHVRGGSNSDISNSTLGVYYKFNEGITGDSATDGIVLDYAGRVTNGTWTGYTAGARNTGSAIVLASASTREKLDPIIRTNHPDFISMQSRLLDSGSQYDYRNNTAFVNLVPSWILDESNTGDSTDLRYISHIMGVYFDKLYHQIQDVPKLRHQTHTSGTFKPISFAEHLPQSLGLYSPEIFIDSSVIEKFINQSENNFFEENLSHAKNLIYQNLYNNLTEIYKAKGTEQAIRNVLKCFNVNDNLLNLKINSNNAEFDLTNNLQLNQLRKNFANFSTLGNGDGVIYQKRLDYTGANLDNIAGCVTGSNAQYGYGFTLESNIIFPFYDELESNNNRLDPKYNQVSLFGCVTVDGTANSSSVGENTTSLNNSVDFGNFKIYFVRDEPQSRSGYFKMVAAKPGSSDIVLTSSVYNEVYSNEPWNLAVRIKPKDYPLQTFVSGNIDDLNNNRKNTYEVVFSGYNPRTADMFDSFRVTASVDTTMGKKYIQSAKRVFVGADKTDVTGELQYKSDVLVSSVAYWVKYLEDTDLQQHAVDFENIGLSGSIQPLFTMGITGPNNSNRNIFVETLNHKTLALNWNFRQRSESDHLGNLLIKDFSSGSATDQENFGWVGSISGREYTGQGTGFDLSSDDAIKKFTINSYKFIDPERAVSSDMVRIFSDEDELTPNLRRKEIIPNFVYSLEKSLYGAISEEILDFFAGVIDFTDIIGHPVNYYRDRYKSMEKLRETFFRRVTRINTVEKYSEYYKWFDNAITTIISQLVPASSEYINEIQNVIESHVLERNKYQNRIMIIDSDKFTIDKLIPDPPLMPGVGASFVNAAQNLVPEEQSPRNTKVNLPFWKKRADRRSAEITSGDSTIDTQRNTIRDVAYTTPGASGSARAPVLHDIKTGTKYTRRDIVRATRGSSMNFNVSTEDKMKGKALNRDKVITRTLKAGVNFEAAKNLEFAASVLRPAGPINRDGGKFVPLNVMVGFVSEATPIPVFKNLSIPDDKIIKKKKTFKVNTGRDWEEGLGYKNVKSGMAFPFNVYSCSVEVSSGYNAEVVSRVGKNLMITNLHNDGYGPSQEIPMQGAFTNDVVGGHQSRHVPLNTGTDQQNNRPEAWRILLGTCDLVPSGAIGVVGPDYPPAAYNPSVGTTPYPYPLNQKAYLYRDRIAKAPVNIKNIKNFKNNKTIPGNYRHQYEIVNTFGATANPRAFVENPPVLPAQLNSVNSTTNVRTFLDLRRGEEEHFTFVDEYNISYLQKNNNKTVVTNRFAYRGAPEIQTLGFKDFRASEFSPYNVVTFRDLSVLKPSQGPSGSIPEDPGSTPATSKVSDIHNKDYGLRSHLARHTAKFGRDSVALDPTAYNLNNAMFVTNKRNAYTSTSGLQGWWRLRDNVSSAGNVTDDSSNGREGTFDAAADRPAFDSTLYPSQFIQTASCTFDGDDEAVNIGAGSLWQTIIGTGTGGTKKMTFSIWLRKTGDGGSNFGRIFGFGRDLTNGQIAIYTNASEQLIFKTDWNGGTSNVWSTGAAFSLNTWTHLAITYDAGATANDPVIYVNGTAVSFVTNATPSGNWDGIASGENCYIGNDSLGSLGWAGQLADAAVWNTILTADEVKALYLVQNLTKTTDLTLTKPEAPGLSYTQLPGFHKLHRNTRQVIVSTNSDNTAFATSSKYDNAFVTRPIPQSDRQYMWLSSSVVDISDIRYAGYQRVFGIGGIRNMAPYRTSSSGLESYWTFVTASEAKRGNHFQSTNGLNIIINDPVSSSTHTLGYEGSVDVSNYTNEFLVGAGANTNYLNQLLTSRGATYGWGWNKFQQKDNRILVKERRKNKLNIATGSDSSLVSYDLPPVSMKGRMAYLNFDTLDIKQDETRIDTLMENGTTRVLRKPGQVQSENLTIKCTNTNEQIFFPSVDLNDYADIDDEEINQPYKDAVAVATDKPNTINWFLYKQNLIPSLRNEFKTQNTKRVGYDNLFWRASPSDRRTLGNTLSSSMIGAPVSRSCWVLDAPQNFLTRTSIFGTSGSQDIMMPNDDMTYFTQVPYVPMTGTAAYNINVPAAGELQNTYFSYFTINVDGGRFATMQMSPLYARKHILGNPKSVASPSVQGGGGLPELGSWGGVSNTGWDLTKQIKPYAGEAVWEAPTQAGIVVRRPIPSRDRGPLSRKILTRRKERSVFLHSASAPWYNGYDEFSADLKALAKGYSVIPEYRMSEHIKDYINYGVINESKTDTFEIVGTPSSSADKNFYIDYSNSDFLENFLGIKETTLLNASEIKLTCHAAIKYNPYKGFYPAQRTVDLAEQFADSFQFSVQGSISGSREGITPFTNRSFGHETTMYLRAAGIMKLLLDPLMSPGILYNSIKSGIAVDYPIVSNHGKRLRRAYGTDVTSSTNNWALSISGSTTVSEYVSGSGEYIGGQYWDKRIPFEAIVEPRKYILNTNFIDMESHPSMSIDYGWGDHDLGPDLVYERQAFTASFNDNADGVYTMMARNFFGACGEFFLQGAGITKLESNTVLDDLQFTKDSNFAGSRPLYMARIRLRKSHNGVRTYDKEYDSFGNVGSVTGGFGLSSFYAINGAKRTINGTQSVGQYPIPQDPMRQTQFKETFTMYSRPTAFGPPCAGRPTGSNAIQFPYTSATRDSFSGFNPAFTPPYYDGEAWADLIFRPHVVDKSDSKTAATEPYDLNRILNETQVVCWRFDPGELRQTGPTASHALQPVLIPVAQKQDTTFAFGSNTKTLYGAGSGSAPAGTGSAINYIKLYNGNTRYNVWFSASVGDIAPAGVPGTAVQVDISSGGSSSAAHYADKFKIVIDALSDFNATVDGTQVTIQNRYTGRPITSEKAGTISPITIAYNQPSYRSPSDDKTIPSIYDGNRINANSMQLTSSVQIFGTKRVMAQETDKFGNVIKNSNTPVGSKWIIQPKWETPMLNFSDSGVHPIAAASGTLTLPIYGSASVPRGMWHQFGVVPDDPNKGIFLEITDIPEDWLKNHYEVLASDRETPYNGNAFGTPEKDKKRSELYKHVRSLTSLCGFDKTNSSVKLGQMKETYAVHEAIVAIPYIISPIEQSVLNKYKNDIARLEAHGTPRAIAKANQLTETLQQLQKERKEFIAIPKRRAMFTREEAAGSAQGDSLDAAGESLRRLKQSLEKYVFPPQFDWLNNKEADPIAMYVFEFKYEFDRDDLSYIWQNLAPRDSSKIAFQKSSVSHNLTNNELMNAKVLENENLRWMVFKVKQRSNTDYYDLIADQANESTRQIEQKEQKLKDYKIGFNWPYDYLSFVELVKMDVDILFKNDATAQRPARRPVAKKPRRGVKIK